MFSFYDYFRNHLIEILLPIRENSGEIYLALSLAGNSQVIKD
jgi:hypothetical protein